MSQFREESCPVKDSHGSPFRYCGFCGWMEEEKPVPGRPPAKEITPVYEDGLDDPPPHHCIMHARRDVFAAGEQYLICCVCHDRDVVKTWRPGDALGKCPGGSQYPDPRTLELEE